MKQKHIVWAALNVLPPRLPSPDWLAVDLTVFNSVKAHPVLPFLPAR